MEKVKNILFVCTGNSCRSIMAEAYLQKRAKEELLGLEVRSAGTMGFKGMKPADNTIKMLKEEKIDPAGYESTKLDEAVLDWADLILVMEPMHKEKIISYSPEAEKKVAYLRKFDDNSEDLMIPDPIGRTRAFYRVSFDIIKRSIEGLITWLKK